MGTKAKRDIKKKKKIIVEKFLEEEPENPYENLGAIGRCMWKWKKYFNTSKKREK